MGLDIDYLANAKRVASTDGAAPDGAVYAFPHPSFPGRSDGIVSGYYVGDAADHFRAGSYGGYNAWRDQLARFAGLSSANDAWAPNAEPNVPFVELINFSDCDGVIGPVTCAKLAADFDAHAERVAAFARSLEDGGEWFAARYAEWRKAFTVASDGGFVAFH